MALDDMINHRTGLCAFCAVRGVNLEVPFSGLEAM